MLLLLHFCSEGNASEFVNRVQKIRKDSGFELTDRIVVKLIGTWRIKRIYREI